MLQNRFEKKLKSNFVINELLISQAIDVAQIHSRALPDDVLPNLGRELLHEYYKSVFKEKDKNLFGVISKDQVIGFCMVSSTSTGLIDVILSKHGILQLIKLIFKKPKIFILGLMQASKKVYKSKFTAEIVFVAVDPVYQEMGVGSTLLLHVNKWCRNNGFLFLQTKTANQFLRDYYLNKFNAKIITQYTLFDRHYSELKWPTSIATEPDFPIKTT